MSRRYAFGFALSTVLGNETRYRNLRKYVDRDPEVDAVWAPIRHYLDPDPFRHYPGPLHTHLVLNREARPVLDRWRTLDAVVVHGFNLFCSMTLRRTRPRPLVVLSQDYTPSKDLTLKRDYGQAVRPGVYQSSRFRIQRAFVRRADFYLPFNQWAATGLVEECGAPRECVEVIHVGVDLDIWKGLPKSAESVPRILFVGGDFERKGGLTLLDAFRQLKGRARLDLVTRSAPSSLPVGVTVYDDLQPNDTRLRELFTAATVFVLPTSADMSPFVCLEAMASRCPVISTRVGAIPEMVREDVNGYLVDPDDPTALARLIDRLVEQPELARRLGDAGRAIVEREYNAETNSARILDILKEQTTRREPRRAS